MPITKKVYQIASSCDWPKRVKATALSSHVLPGLAADHSTSVPITCKAVSALISDTVMTQASRSMFVLFGNPSLPGGGPAQWSACAFSRSRRTCITSSGTACYWWSPREVAPSVDPFFGRTRLVELVGEHPSILSEIPRRDLPSGESAARSVLSPVLLSRPAPLPVRPIGLPPGTACPRSVCRERLGEHSRTRGSFACNITWSLL